MYDENHGYQEVGGSTAAGVSGAFDGGELRDAIGSVVLARRVSSVPYDAIVTSGRRRTRNLRIVGAAAGVVVIAGAAFAIPAAGSGSSDVGKPATAATQPKATSAPTPTPTPLLLQQRVGVLQAALGGVHPVASGVIDGHTWSVTAAISPDEKAFELSRPDLFPHGADTYTDIPYAWIFRTIDGQTQVAGNQDLVPSAVDKDIYLNAGGASIGGRDSTGQYVAMLEYGVVNDPKIDHYGIVYAGHTDVLTPTMIGGHKAFAFAVSFADQPKTIIAYDKSGHEIGREPGALVSRFSSEPPKP